VTDAYVFEALRSPRTKAKESGGLHELTPSDLLAQLYDALVLRTQVDPVSLSEVILGCVTQQGEQAANIAKTSALGAGWPASVAGMTINRFCSSSIDAIALAAMKVNCGQASALVAGGVEMMSRVPLMADGARVFADHDFGVSHQMLLMGAGADLIASRGEMSREDLDAVAFGSHQRALRAQQEQRFSSIVPIATSKGIISTDECVRPSLTPDRLAAMPAVFDVLGKAGSDQVQLAKFPELKVITHLHTAANSPAMCDAAAVLMIGSSDFAERQGLRPLARIVDTVTCCAEPLEVVSGCVEATKTILELNRLLPDDVDVFEIHEAFAATIVKLQREHAIDAERLNVNGGCIALGHPMGATGAIMAGTALDELKRAEGRLALVAASGAGGTGSALLLERCD
jgi:acetyl-CoA C-acetyltransferase